MSQSGNNAVGVASGASTAHVGGGLNGGGVGDKVVSIASGASTIFIGGNLSGGDVGEGINLSVLSCRTSSGENAIAKFVPLFIPSPYVDV